MSKWSDAPAIAPPMAQPKWMSAPAITPQASQPAAAEPDYSPDKDMGGWEKFLVGAGSSMDKAYRGVRQLLPGGEEATAQGAEDAALYQKHRPQGWQTTAGEMAGDAAAYAPLALVPGGVAAQMAAAGAMGGALTPGDLKERALGAGLNAAGAGAGQALAKTLARVAKPVGDVTGEARLLQLEGVQPTFGQIMGSRKGVIGKGIARAEEAAESVPIAGSAIKARKAEALDQWRKATREAATPTNVPKVADTVSEVRGDVGRAYEGALRSEQMPYSAVKYTPDLDTLARGLPVTKEQKGLVAQAFDEIRLKHLANTGGAAQPTAAAAHATESELKTLAARYSGSQDPAQQDLGSLFKKLADEYGDAWRQALPKDLQRKIGALDRQYPDLLAIEDAARKTGSLASDANPNNYSPADLLRAGRTVDRSGRKANYLAEEAPQQELAAAAQRVLAGKVRDSGTAERAALINALGAATGIGAGFLTGGVGGAAATLGGVAAYGSKPVQRYLTGRSFPKAQQQALEALRKAAPAAGALGAYVGHKSQSKEKQPTNDEE